MRHMIIVYVQKLRVLDNNNSLMFYEFWESSFKSATATALLKLHSDTNKVNFIQKCAYLWTGGSSDGSKSFWYDTIFICCNWFSSRWQRSVDLYKNRIQTAIYRRGINTQNSTGAQKTWNIKKYKIRKQA